MIMQIGNGVSNVMMQPNQAVMFATNGISLNGTYTAADSLSIQQQSKALLTQQTTANGQQTADANSLPMNDATFAILMDKLHSKSNQMKSWTDLSKSLKQSLLEKRPFVNDINDKLQLQRALDTMQNNIEVKSVQSMVERLDTICRQLKLKFNCTKNYECFVSSDMYYVEIKLDPDTGHVLDCNVVHSDASQVSFDIPK